MGNNAISPSYNDVGTYRLGGEEVHVTVADANHDNCLNPGEEVSLNGQWQTVQADGTLYVEGLGFRTLQQLTGANASDISRHQYSSLAGRMDRALRVLRDPNSTYDQRMNASGLLDGALSEAFRKGSELRQK